MYIQLAEGRRRRTKISGYRRRANNVRPHFRALHETSPDAGNPYIFIPRNIGRQYGFDNDINIREDNLDFLQPSEWRMLMAQLASYQPAVEDGTMSEGMFMADRASRKAKREQKKADQQAKSAGKTAKSTSRADKKAAKTELIRARAKAKSEGRGSDVLGSLIDGAKSIFGKGDTAVDTTQPDGAPGGGTTPEGYEKAWYQTTGGMVGIGIGVLALAGGAYALTRKK